MTVEEGIRRAVSKLGRNVQIPRRLPREVGGAWLLTSTEGGLKYLKPQTRSIEPQLLDFAHRFVRPGDFVWDIGANLGLFTFAAAGCAGKAGRVLAVDADTWLCNLLRRSATMNCGLAAVDVLAAAISNTVGLVSFEIARESRACSAIAGQGNALLQEVRGPTQLVPSTTLDAVLEHVGPPNVVKLDIEHAEVLALQGAGNLLQSARPVMHLEVSPDNYGEVGTLLDGYSFSLWDPETFEQIETPRFNTIAVPEERVETYGLPVGA